MNTGTGIGFQDAGNPLQSLQDIPESERTWREKQALKAALLAQEALVRLEASCRNDLLLRSLPEEGRAFSNLPCVKACTSAPRLAVILG